MITTILIKILTLLISVLVFVLPDWSLPDNVLNAISYPFQHLMQLNGLFPISEILLVLVLLLTFEILLLTYKLSTRIISFFRGSGSL